MNAKPVLLPAVPGFQDAIREYVVHSIGISFRRVSMRVLADWLKLEPPALKQLLADKVGLGAGQVKLGCLPAEAVLRLAGGLVLWLQVGLLQGALMRLPLTYVNYPYYCCVCTDQVGGLERAGRHCGAASQRLQHGGAEAHTGSHWV